jgi:hypothetical protein
VPVTGEPVTLPLEAVTATDVAAFVSAIAILTEPPEAITLCAGVTVKPLPANAEPANAVPRRVASIVAERPTLIAFLVKPKVVSS